MDRLICRGLSAAAVVALWLTAEAVAHGFAGDRFFPATILIDDPFVASEMPLPTFTLNATQSDGSRGFDRGSDLSMLLTPNWDFTRWTAAAPEGLPNAAALVVDATRVAQIPATSAPHTGHSM